ncbi:winged helix DNA-binding domain-containing protein [Aggregicoccus sp. 17bor-14]|uniref:winged helix DNA-binding domain-containing protein n=1 Tax=Myxococcaceae TaxID=31 RepID=UPI00129C53F4|nr:MULTISPECIES: winged helix DNA-binding domain-containing protein [Myxococcaceae]MBF5046628.1 AlkZ family DNA glycosylase [Simulacricoccus sp. 17bor-14]MRI92338.1 winged helix DNA-binding domain-containing protein [Aggregicoccus sp. 17bor-14]
MARAKSSAAVLTPRALNRALLARQHLLQRAQLTVPQLLEHLVGLQAQAPNPPYYGLWSRLEGFRHEALSGLVQKRKVVRLALMRSTIHLVTARDALRLRPLVQPVLERGLKGNHGRRLVGVDLEAVAQAGRALLEERPRTLSELGEALAPQFPRGAPESLAMAVRCLAPLVQVPPRGLWGVSGGAVHTTAEAWLGRAPEATLTLDALVLRYLGAFGPASVKDVQTWCGLTRLDAVLERLRPRLAVFHDAQGRELFDLPEAPRPPEDAPAPPRLLAEWDNVLLSHAERSRIARAEDLKVKVFTQNGIVPGTVLLDGFVAGTWRLVRERAGTTLRIETFGPLSRRDRGPLGEEAERLLAFAAGDAPRTQVQFVRHAGEAVPSGRGVALR